MINKPVLSLGLSGLVSQTLCTEDYIFLCVCWHFQLRVIVGPNVVLFVYFYLLTRVVNGNVCRQNLAVLQAFL